MRGSGATKMPSASESFPKSFYPRNPHVPSQGWQRPPCRPILVSPVAIPASRAVCRAGLLPGLTQISLEP